MLQLFVVSLLGFFGGLLCWMLLVACGYCLVVGLLGDSCCGWFGGDSVCTCCVLVSCLAGSLGFVVGWLFILLLVFGVCFWCCWCCVYVCCCFGLDGCCWFCCVVV